MHVSRIGVVAAALGLMLVAEPADAQRRRLAVQLFDAQVVLDTVGVPVTIDASPGEAYAASLLVLRHYGIEPTIRDSIGGQLGDLTMVRMSRLNRVPLSQFFNCGSTMTGLRADSYRLTMPLVVMLDPVEAKSTRIRIALIASAQDAAGSSNQPVFCGSTGALESRLQKAIEEQVREMQKRGTD